MYMHSDRVLLEMIIVMSISQFKFHCSKSNDRKLFMLRIAFRRRARLVCHLIFFSLSFSTWTRKVSFCDFMISRTENQKILVEKGVQSTKTKLLPFFFRIFLGPFVRLQKSRQKDDFE